MAITHIQVPNVRINDDESHLLDIHRDLIALAEQHPFAVVDLASSEHCIYIENCTEELMLEIAAQLPRYVDDTNRGHGFQMNGTTLEIW